MTLRRAIRGAAMGLERLGPVATVLAWRLRWHYLRARKELAATPRTTWPRTTDHIGGRPRLGIVVVNFNTARLISQLLFSLYRILGRSEFAIVVVVDNGSTDGSRQILDSLAEAQLIHLVANAEQQYHGPALNQGISWLANRQESAAGPEDRIQYVWSLDSDVVVLRHDTARDALEAFQGTGAAAVGQIQDNPMTRRALRNNLSMLSPFSLILDPVQIWQPSIPPFLDDGAPATGMQVAADADGLRLVSFPFVERGYLIHLGRGTLRAVAESRDTTNRYYEWAAGHNEPYYMGQEGAPSAYRRFCEVFDEQVGDLTPARVTAACSAAGLLSLD
jgi:Glycosyl transferase family 2